MRWIRRLFQKSRAEKTLDQKLRFHLDSQVADYVALGIPPEEARRRAMLEFGGIERVKEEVRGTRWETHLENLFAFIGHHHSDHVPLRSCANSPRCTQRLAAAAYRHRQRSRRKFQTRQVARRSGNH